MHKPTICQIGKLGSNDYILATLCDLSSNLMRICRILFPLISFNTKSKPLKDFYNFLKRSNRKSYTKKMFFLYSLDYSTHLTEQECR